MNKKTLMVNIKKQKSPLIQKDKPRATCINLRNTMVTPVNYYKFLSIIINVDVSSEDLKER